MLIGAYTKSGGSWFRWMLIDLLYEPEVYLDQLPDAEVKKYIDKVEKVGKRLPDIFLLRNPLDLVCSAYNYCNLTNRIVNEIDFYTEFFTCGTLQQLNRVSFKRFVEWANNSQNPIFLYENLLTNTRNILADVTGRPLARCDITIQKYSLDSLRAREINVNPEKIQRITNKEYSFFNKGTKYYFEEKVPEDLIALGKEYFFEELNSFWPELLQ